MGCKYHPNAMVKGVCKCGKEFCEDCANTIIGEKVENFCLDCAAELAKKKIIRSYIAAGIGFVLGIGVATSSKENWGVTGVFLPFVYAYVFWAAYFGWSYGGRIFSKLFSIQEDSFIGNYLILSIRLVVAALVGVFGGGISQYMAWRNILKKQQSLSAVASATN